MKYVPETALAQFADLYGTQRDAIEKFASGEDWNDGTVYRYPHETGPRLLKVMQADAEGPDGSQRLDERLRYLYYLGTGGAPIIYPVKSANGKIVERVEAEASMYQAYSWDMVQGRHLDSNSPAELIDVYRQWGRAIGCTHHLAKKYPDWEQSPILDALGNPISSWRREMDFFGDMLVDDEVKVCWKGMREELESVPRTRDNFGFIHNDPHAHNLLITNDGVVLLDFDVANYHWFAVDLAVAIYSEFYRVWHMRPVPLTTKRMVVDSLLEGYSRENSLPWEELDRLEFFLLYRRVLMFALFYKQIGDSRPDYLRQMKHDILERRPFLRDDYM